MVGQQGPQHGYPQRPVAHSGITLPALPHQAGQRMQQEQERERLRQQERQQQERQRQRQRQLQDQKSTPRPALLPQRRRRAPLVDLWADPKVDFDSALVPVPQQLRPQQQQPRTRFRSTPPPMPRAAWEEEPFEERKAFSGRPSPTSWLDEDDFLATMSWLDEKRKAVCPGRLTPWDPQNDDEATTSWLDEERKAFCSGRFSPIALPDDDEATTLRDGWREGMTADEDLSPRPDVQRRVGLRRFLPRSVLRAVTSSDRSRRRVSAFA